MADRTKTGLRVLLDVKRFVPTPAQILQPFPSPKEGEMVMQGVTADVVGWALGNIPAVGDIAAAFVNDNIMADVLAKLTPAQQAEYRAQNRVYPNGIALLRTFQRVSVAPGGSS